MATRKISPVLVIVFVSLLGLAVNRLTSGFLMDSHDGTTVKYIQPKVCVDRTPKLCAVARKAHQCNNTFVRENCCASSCPQCEDVEDGCDAVKTSGLCAVPDFAFACCETCGENVTQTTPAVGAWPWD